MLSSNSFKKFLDNTNCYSVIAMKSYFNIENNLECLTFILDFLNSEINFLEKKYIFKSFKILNDSKGYDENINFDIINSKLDNLEETISKLSLDSDNNIRLFLNIVCYNIDLVKKQISFINNNKDAKDKLIEFADYLIFDVRNINLCIELFKTFPTIINKKDIDGEYLLIKILSKYINILVNNNSEYILSYYDNIINHLLDSCRDYLYPYLKDKFLNRLTDVKNNYNDSKILTFINRVIVNIDSTYIFDSIEDINRIYNIDFTEPKYSINIIPAKDYLDKTDKFVISIDGEFTKIRDDAFSITKTPNGNYLLEIYASSVSPYVLLGSSLDKRAKEIGKTIWTSLGTIYMLPYSLSKDILSLNVNEKKHSICYSFEFTKDLELVYFDIKRVFIKPNYNLTFDDVNREITKNNFKDDNLYKTLKMALKFLELNEYNNASINEYHALKTIRRQILNINNKSRELENDNHNNGEKLINIFKLLVGNHVSSLINSKGLPFIYRVNTAKLGNNLEELKSKIGDLSNNSKLLHIVNSSIGKSFYSTENLGHKGLGLDCYSNVTISIRNYISLVLERLICRYLIDKNIPSDKELHDIEKYLFRLCEDVNLKMQLNEDYVLEISNLKEKVLKKEP